MTRPCNMLWYCSPTWRSRSCPSTYSISGWYVVLKYSSTGTAVDVAIDIVYAIGEADWLFPPRQPRQPQRPDPLMQIRPLPPCGSFLKERSLAERTPTSDAPQPAIVVQRAYDLALWLVKKVEK